MDKQIKLTDEQREEIQKSVNTFGTNGITLKDVRESREIFELSKNELQEIKDNIATSAWSLSNKKIVLSLISTIENLQEQLNGIGVEQYYALQWECREQGREIQRLRKRVGELIMQADMVERLEKTNKAQRDDFLILYKDFNQTIEVLKWIQERCRYKHGYTVEDIEKKVTEYLSSLSQGTEETK